MGRDAVLRLPEVTGEYRGFDRHDLVVDWCPTIAVVPRQPLPGRPWVLRAQFFDAFPGFDIAMLDQGYHLIYLEVGNTFGCPSALDHWEVLYRLLTTRYGFSPRPVLEGLSRGGLFIYNWAVRHPTWLACLYGDAPVCDFRSWPGGKGQGPGSPEDWTKLIVDYGFVDEAEALAYPGNPIDRLAPLAAAQVPIIHVYGEADEAVPWEENTGVVAVRYRALGGHLELIPKPGVGHHPHGLEDPAPVVAFCRRYAEDLGNGTRYRERIDA